MLDYFLLSEKGERENNEDFISYMVIDDNNACFFLADGLGGHGRGDEASRLAVQTAESYFKEHYSEGDVMEKMFEAAQNAVLDRQSQPGARCSMKTTLNILQITSDSVRIGHIGDSRTYYFYKGKYISRTHDHSVPQVLADIGDIPEKMIRSHPDRNRLLRVVGEQWSGLSYEFMEPVERKHDSDFLMCTDGFWELVDEKAMKKTLKSSENAMEWIKSMRDIVMNTVTEKEKDNFSAIGIRL